VATTAMQFCFPVQNVTDIKNWLQCYGQKTSIKNMAAIRHLEF